MSNYEFQLWGVMLMGVIGVVASIRWVRDRFNDWRSSGAEELELVEDDTSLPLVASFRSGDEIPEWLLVQEPMSSRARAARLTFHVGIEVYLWRGIHIIVPETCAQFGDFEIFDYRGARDVTIMGGERVAWVPTGGIVFTSDDPMGREVIAIPGVPGAGGKA